MQAENIEQAIAGQEQATARIADTAGSGESDLQDWTVEECSRALGMSRGAVIRRLEDGILPGYKVERAGGFAWRVKPVWLQKQNQKRQSNPAKSTKTGSQSGAAREANISTSTATEAEAEAASEAATASVANLSAADAFSSAPADTADLNSKVCIESSMSTEEGYINFEPDQVRADEASNNTSSSSQSGTDAQSGDEIQQTPCLILDDFIQEEEEQREDLERQIIELKARLELSESRANAGESKLESANIKIGYLQAKLESSQEALKLITDSSPGKSWWSRFCALFTVQS